MSPRIQSPKKKKCIDELFRLCRLCGAGGESYKQPICQNDNELDGTSVELSDKIKECVHIEVTKDDKMPPLICELCINKINDFYLFRLLCKETNNQTRMKLGLPPQNYSPSPVIESALSVTLLLCDHDSSDSEPIVPQSTQTPTKRKLSPIWKQTEKEQIPPKKPLRLPKDTEPAQKDPPPLQEKISNKGVRNRKLIRCARKLKPITLNAISQEKEEPTLTDVKEKENDVPTELPPENTEHSLVKTIKEKQASMHIPIIKNKSNFERDTEIATLRQDRISINFSLNNKEIAAKNNKSAKSNLKKHERTHTGEKPYKCNVCSDRFSLSSSLKTHKRTHTGEKSYKCDVCECRFNKLGNLNRHIRTHNGKKPYKCDVCEYRCNQLFYLKTHKLTHTGEKPYKCDVCEYRCNRVDSLKTHKRKHTGEKPYKCDVCDYRCSLLASLKTHKRTHTGEKPYNCDVCEYRCSHIGSLKLHKITHIGEKPYKCDLCEYRCKRIDSLKSHERTHTGEKRYKCNICKYKFNQLGNLKTHKLTHTGEKPYKCDLCEYRCNQLGSLKTHKRTHTGEKPYKCDVCEYRFNVQGHLKTHKRTHTEEKPYKCDVCEYRCNQLGSLKRHKITHTK